VSIEIDRAGGDTETFIDQAWTSEDATGNTRGRLFPIDAPFTIHAGDTARLSCTWENTTTDPIAFPREMGVFFGYTRNTSFVCGNGVWLTPAQASAAGMGPGDIGTHL
jgi:hypothetical protein